MCGRYSQTKIKEKELKDRFRLKKVPPQLQAQFNIAPGQAVQVVLNSAPQELRLARWGLVPSWSKEPKTQYSMINACAETITQKPAYRGLIRHKRCLVIADSFYEWKKTGGRKQPYRIMLKDGAVFAMAGLWDLWSADGGELLSCSIITTGANELVGGIHERMPVILSPQEEAAWLGPTPLEEITGMLRPYDSTSMRVYPVSTLVNSPSNNSEAVLAETAAGALD